MIRLRKRFGWFRTDRRLLICMWDLHLQPHAMAVCGDTARDLKEFVLILRFPYQVNTSWMEQDESVVEDSHCSGFRKLDQFCFRATPNFTLYSICRTLRLSRTAVFSKHHLSAVSSARAVKPESKTFKWSPGGGEWGDRLSPET